MRDTWNHNERPPPVSTAQLSPLVVRVVPPELWLEDESADRHRSSSHPPRVGVAGVCLQALFNWHYHFQQPPCPLADQGIKASAPSMSARDAPSYYPARVRRRLPEHRRQSGTAADSAA